MPKSTGHTFKRKALVMILGAACVGSCPAAELVVTSLADDGGTCPGPDCTLRSALASVTFGDVITFDPTLPYPAMIMLTEGELLLDREAIVVGPGADNLTLSANDASRVLTVAPNVNARLSGLTLAHGKIRGADGQDGTGDSQPFMGASVEGGCIRVLPDASLHLDHVAIRHCLARSGDGGAGSLNCESNPGASNGSNGGFASGGAVAIFGNMELVSSSVSFVAAIGGDGGHGGNEGCAYTPVTPAGRGGDGGMTEGGAIWVSSIGSIELLNSSILRVAAYGGSGGDGGTRFLETVGGNGGNGGDIRGGVLLNYGHMRASFSTFESEVIGRGSAGVAGTADGGDDGVDGDDGVIEGTVLWAPPDQGGQSLLRGSAIIDQKEIAYAGTQACQPSVTALSTYAMDGSCGADFVAPLANVFPGSIRSYRGLDELVPLQSPFVVDAVTDCIDLDGVTVTSDQADRDRPFDGDDNGVANCDIGAVELDHDGIFADGFD